MYNPFKQAIDLLRQWRVSALSQAHINKYKGNFDSYHRCMGQHEAYTAALMLFEPLEFDRAEANQ